MKVRVHIVPRARGGEVSKLQAQLLPSTIITLNSPFLLVGRVAPTRLVCWKVRVPVLGQQNVTASNEYSPFNYVR